MKKTLGIILSGLGLLGVVGGYISMVLTPATFVVLFMGKLLGIFEGVWFSSQQVSVFGTPLLMAIGGLLFLILSLFTIAIGAAIEENHL